MDVRKMKNTPRQIEPKMIEFFNERLNENSIASAAIEKKDAMGLFFETIESCVGIREVGGNNQGPLVELIQETIGHANKEAWCMALMQTGIAYVEHKLDIVSPFPATEHCMTAWRDGQEQIGSAPYPGSIAIWNHVGTSRGHTGMVLEISPKMFKTIEGNTDSGIDSDGEITREGGGVYIKQRSLRGSGDMKLMGFLKPF